MAAGGGGCWQQRQDTTKHSGVYHLPENVLVHQEFHHEENTLLVHNSNKTGQCRQDTLAEKTQSNRDITEQRKPLAPSPSTGENKVSKQEEKLLIRGDSRRLFSPSLDNACNFSVSIVLFVISRIK